MSSADTDYQLRLISPICDIILSRFICMSSIHRSCRSAYLREQEINLEVFDAREEQGLRSGNPRGVLNKGIVKKEVFGSNFVGRVSIDKFSFV